MSVAELTVPETVAPAVAEGGRVVLVDDEPAVIRSLSAYLERSGWRTTTCRSAAEALEVVASQDVDVLVTDLNMPETSGNQLIQELRRRGFRLPILVVTAYGTVDAAVECMQTGAFDFLCKPFELERVRLTLNRAYLHSQLQHENDHLRRELKEKFSCGNLVGNSPKMREVYDLVHRAARSRASVLITGESGTGKELVARALHYESARANKKFVPVSCAALPTELLESELFGHEKGAFTGANWQRIGRFELADGGTLFLDEIGDISHDVQVKLLRVLQEREIDRVGGAKPIKVDVRLICATHRDLSEAIRTATFREDLYYRIRVLEIPLPALRERPEDIPLLAHHFLEKLSRRDGKQLAHISDGALSALEAHNWPGNVRELENVIEQSVVLANPGEEVLNRNHLPPSLHGGAVDRAGSVWSRRLALAERDLLQKALEQHRWDLQETANHLELPFRSLCSLVRRHGLAERSNSASQEPRSDRR